MSRDLWLYNCFCLLFLFITLHCPVVSVSILCILSRESRPVALFVTRTLLGGCHLHSSMKVLLCVDLCQLHMESIGLPKFDLQERIPPSLPNF